MTTAGTKHGGSTGFGPPQVRLNKRCYPWPALAPCEAEDRLQSGSPNIQMSPWSRSTLSCETVRTSFRRAWEAVSEIFLDTRTNCTANKIGSFRLPTIWSVRTDCLEFSSCATS